MQIKVLLGIACAAALAACGGGGSDGGSGNKANNAGTGFTPNSVQMSDILFNARGFTNERVETDCASDLSSCTATWRGQTLTADEDDLEIVGGGDGEGTPYLALGTWEHMQVGVVRWELEDGVSAKVAIAGGMRHANSLPPTGRGTWRGAMVALDHEDRLVHGNAMLTISDFREPAVDVELTPSGRTVMTWQGIPVTGGGFRQEDRDRPDDYIKGEFYGPYAQEVGGVFERNRMIGAFGAK